MTATESHNSTRGRGRPRTEHPLSNAERQRRYRERQKSADKPENPQTLQRLTQLQDRIERLENRQQEQFLRIEKRQNELEHRLKSLQSLLTRVVQRLEGGASPALPNASSRGGSERSGSRKKIAASHAPALGTEAVTWPELSLPQAAPSVVESPVAAPVTPVAEPVAADKPVPYYLNAGNRCQIATGREGSQCSGKVSHTIVLKSAPDDTPGEFGVCQIHFRQFLQQRMLTPCAQDEPPLREDADTPVTRP